MYANIEKKRRRCSQSVFQVDIFNNSGCTKSQSACCEEKRTFFEIIFLFHMFCLVRYQLYQLKNEILDPVLQQLTFYRLFFFCIERHNWKESNETTCNFSLHIDPNFEGSFVCVPMYLYIHELLWLKHTYLSYL